MLLKILNKYPDWKANVVGDEQRDKIEFKHKNLKIKYVEASKENIKVTKKNVIFEDVISQDATD